MSGSQSTGKHSLNSTVFSSWRKATKVGAFLTWAGTEFQALAAAAGKARSPSVERRVDGTSSVMLNLWVQRGPEKQQAVSHCWTDWPQIIQCSVATRLVYGDMFTGNTVTRWHRRQFDAERKCRHTYCTYIGLYRAMALTPVEGWRDEPCEPTVRLADWSELVASYSRMKSAWGWANEGKPILVCYIQKYVIIMGGIFPLTSSPTKILGDVSPASPAALTPVIYTVSQKTRLLTLAINFTNYWPIFKIFSLLDSVGNL